MNLRVEPAGAAILLVDFQERLSAVMAADERDACIKNILIVLELARRLSIPVVVSEQYPAGLGRTIAALEAAVGRLGPGVPRLEKLEFACTESPDFRAIFDRLDRKQWILVGMETHVCVYQTARGLLSWGAQVQVPIDAVVSRRPANKAIGLDLARQAGAVITATEALVFDALVRAGTDDFRAMSRMVK